jgi:hypothetical protein
MNSEAKVYTWEIEDYFVLKNPSYSPELQAPWIQMVIASSAYNA